MQVLIIDAGLTDREAHTLFKLIDVVVDVMRPGYEDKTRARMVDMWEIEPEGYEVIRDVPRELLLGKIGDVGRMIALYFNSFTERELYDAAVALKRSRQT